MKREILRSIACIGTISLVGTGAFGQAAGGVDQTRERQQDNQPGISGQRQSGLTSSSSQTHGGAQSQLLRFSQLIGANIQSYQGNSIGQVRDLAVDPQSGRIEMALVSLSSSSSSSRSATQTPGTSATTSDLNRSATDPDQRSSDLSTTPGSSATSRGASSLGSDMGKLVAVPWQLLRASHSSSSAIGSSTTSQPSSTTTTTTPGSITSGSSAMASSPTLTFTGEESKLKNAPSFDYSTFTGASQSMFAQRVYSHFGLDWNNRQSSVGGAGSGITSGADRSTDLNRPDSSTTKPNRDKDNP